MFLNYLAGVVSLVLAISAFVPWVTIWFYSLKGIESIYGIGILLVGLLGVTISAFHHLSGKIGGRAFMVCSLAALACEGLYFRKMLEYGDNLSKAFHFLQSVLLRFGDKILAKVQARVGENVIQTVKDLVDVFGIKTSLNSFDFVGGGLILAVISSVILLVVGILLEKNKTTVD